MVAQLIGQRGAYILNVYDFKLGWEIGSLLEPGDIVTLTDPHIPLSAFPVRIRTLDEDENGNWAVNAEEFPGDIATASGTRPAQAVTNTTVNVDVDPGNVNPPAIFEPASSLTGGTPQVWVAASGGANWGGAIVSISFDNVNFNAIGSISNPAAQGTLTAALPSTADPDTVDTLAIDTTESDVILPTDATDADANAYRTLCLLTAAYSTTVPSAREAIAYGAVAAGAGEFDSNLTYLRRGLYGTVPTAFAIGDFFTRMNLNQSAPPGNTVLIYDLPAQYIGTSIYLKFQSFNRFGNATQDISAVATYQYATTGAGYGGGTGGVPATPTGLTATPGNNQIALSWNANAATDSITQYKLYAGHGHLVAFGSCTLIFEGSALGYTHTGLATSDEWTYYLAATNAIGNSSPEGPADATTSAAPAKDWILYGNLAGQPAAGQELFNITALGRRGPAAEPRRQRGRLRDRANGEYYLHAAAERHLDRHHDHRRERHRGDLHLRERRHLQRGRPVQAHRAGDRRHDARGALLHLQGDALTRHGNLLHRRLRQVHAEHDLGQCEQQQQHLSRRPHGRRSGTAFPAPGCGGVHREPVERERRGADMERAVWRELRSENAADNYATLIGGFRFNDSLAVGKRRHPILRQHDPAGRHRDQFERHHHHSRGRTARPSPRPRSRFQPAPRIISNGASPSHRLAPTPSISTERRSCPGPETSSSPPNAYANTIRLGVFNSTTNTVISYDDLYLDDGTGSILATNPVVETHVETSDSATAQFSVGASVFGASVNYSNATNAPGANTLFLRAFTPTVSGTLASISTIPAATSSTAKFKAVVYADSSNKPGSLLATGNEVVGTGTAAWNNVLTSSFSSPPSLTAGTQYWIGFITDTSVALELSDNNTNGQQASNTYTSGAPGTAPTMSTGKNDWILWGNLDGRHQPAPTRSPRARRWDISAITATSSRAPSGRRTSLTSARSSRTPRRSTPWPSKGSSGTVTPARGR